MAKKSKSKKPVRVVRRAMLKAKPTYAAPTETKKDNTKLIVGAGVVVLVLASIGYYVYSRQQAAPEETTGAAPAAGASSGGRSTGDLRQPKSAETMQAIAAAVAGPTVYYSNGTTATVAKAEAEQMVASGQFRWANALKTALREGAPGQATSMARRR